MRFGGFALPSGRERSVRQGALLTLSEWSLRALSLEIRPKLSDNEANSSSATKGGVKNGMAGGAITGVSIKEEHCLFQF